MNACQCNCGCSEVARPGRTVCDVCAAYVVHPKSGEVACVRRCASRYKAPEISPWFAACPWCGLDLHPDGWQADTKQIAWRCSCLLWREYATGIVLEAVKRCTVCGDGVARWEAHGEHFCDSCGHKIARGDVPRLSLG